MASGVRVALLLEVGVILEVLGHNGRRSKQVASQQKCARSAICCHQTKNPVSSWIRCADAVQPHLPLQIPALYSTDLLCPFRDEEATIVLLVGPIGCGKTTTAQLMSTEFDIPHVDGDLLFGLDAQCFSAERNIATVSLVMQSLMQQWRVIVSSGGGALGSDKKQNPKSKPCWTFALREKIMNMLPGIV